MNKRETALEIIRTEYAKYGKETREAMRAYVENRISAEARNEAVKQGLRIFEELNDKTEEAEIKILKREELGGGEVI